MGCWNGSWNRWLPAVPNNVDGRNVPDIERWFLGICCSEASSIWMYHPTSLSDYCFVMLSYPLVFLLMFFAKSLWNMPSILSGARGPHICHSTLNPARDLSKMASLEDVGNKSWGSDLRQWDPVRVQSVLLHAAQGVCGRGLPLPWLNVACHARWTKKFLLSILAFRSHWKTCWDTLFLMVVSSLGSSLSFWIVLWQFRLEVLDICDLRSCKVQGPEVKLHQMDCSDSVALLQFSESNKPTCCSTLPAVSLNAEIDFWWYTVYIQNMWNSWKTKRHALLGHQTTSQRCALTLAEGLPAVRTDGKGQHFRR